MFKVKTYKWVRGTLNADEFEFSTIEEARTFLQLSSFNSAKIVDESLQVIDQLESQILVEGNTSSAEEMTNIIDSYA